MRIFLDDRSLAEPKLYSVLLYTGEISEKSGKNGERRC
jgi:hypothetical protein